MVDGYPRLEEIKIVVFRVASTLESVPGWNTPFLPMDQVLIGELATIPTWMFQL